MIQQDQKHDQIQAIFAMKEACLFPLLISCILVRNGFFIWIHFLYFCWKIQYMYDELTLIFPAQIC